MEVVYTYSAKFQLDKKIYDIRRFVLYICMYVLTVKSFCFLQKVMVRSSCDKCGGYRFMPCLICHGSKKSLHRNDFTEEFCALRCMQCDENGLMRCDMCLDQQE
jgi:hypothetical protein